MRIPARGRANVSTTAPSHSRLRRAVEQRAKSHTNGPKATSPRTRLILTDHAAVMCVQRGG